MAFDNFTSPTKDFSYLSEIIATLCFSVPQVQLPRPCAMLGPSTILAILGVRDASLTRVCDATEFTHVANHLLTDVTTSVLLGSLLPHVKLVFVNQITEGSVAKQCCYLLLSSAICSSSHSHSITRLSLFYFSKHFPWFCDHYLLVEELWRV